jgi:hypothetical protein
LDIELLRFLRSNITHLFNNNDYLGNRHMRHTIRPLFWRLSLLAAATVLASGCAGSSPTIDTTDEAGMSFDGLYPVKGGSADIAWARPGADISQYTKIMLQGVGIEYRPGGETGRRFNPRPNSDDHYEISDQQKKRLEELLRDAFREELGKSERFTIVDKAAPDVLLIRGALLDVVSFTPPDPVGRSEIFLSSFGEATLVLEIRDSVSEAIIARAVDRRAADPAGQAMSRSNSANTTMEVRRMVKAWARLLRERLDTYGAPQN